MPFPPPVHSLSYFLQSPILPGETATHCSILPRKILWTEELGGLQSMGLKKKSDITDRLNNNQHSHSHLLTQRIASIPTLPRKPRNETRTCTLPQLVSVHISYTFVAINRDTPSLLLANLFMY